MEFRCSGCYALLRTKPEEAGRQFECPKCGRRLTVPQPEVTPPPAPPPRPAAPKQPTITPASGPFGPGAPTVNPYQAPQAPVYSSYPSPGSRQSGLAVASVVLGACSLATTCCCGFFAFPLALVGLVLGILVLKSEDRSTAVIGIVLSSIGLLLGLAALLYVVAMMVADPVFR